jgi:DNA-directed RNA polymerase subunit RPC12/RpoP
MEKDPVMLRKLYASWKTEDLKKAIAVDKADYEPGAIDIIKEELQSRNVNTEDLDSFYKQVVLNYIREEESLKNEGKLFCPKCHSLNIIKKKWRWWYFLTIPIIGAFGVLIWVLLEFFNLGWLQLPLCMFLVFMLCSRKKYRCDDCGYHFRRRALKERGSVLGNLWEKVKAEL